MINAKQHISFKAALGHGAQSPLARMMAGFTGFAVAATLILAMAIPAPAERAFCGTSSEPMGSCAQ